MPLLHLFQTSFSCPMLLSTIHVLMHHLPSHQVSFTKVLQFHIKMSIVKTFVDRYHVTLIWNVYVALE